MTEGQWVIIHQMALRDLFWHRGERRERRLNFKTSVKIWTVFLMCHRTPDESEAAECWGEMIKNIFIGTKVNTCLHKCHLEDFPQNFISTWQEVEPSLLTLESDVGQAASVFVMQLKISSSSGVCVGCRACLCLYLQCAAEPSPKSPFDTFITITYMVDRFTAYKCCYRGEALGFCIWLCKNYLHNQVF